MSELKPCPFCGGEPVVEGNLVACNNLNCPTHDNYWTDPMIFTCDHWNTRPIEDVLNARIIEVTHLYLQTKDAFNLVTEVLLKQDARIAKLEEKLAELVEVGNKMRDLIEQDYDGYLDETIEWRGVAEEADDVLQEREK